MTEDGEHHELRTAIGAYVLGHLDGDERERVRAHLEGCAQCRADRDELAPAAAALIGTNRPQPVVEPPLALRQQIEDRIRVARRGEGRARALRAAAVATVAGAAAATTLVIGLRVTEPDAPPAVPLEAVAVAEVAQGVVASADLVAHTWGIEVKLEVTGLEAGARYDMTIVGADGTVYPAGAFIGTGADAVRCNLNAGVLRDAATAFEVRDAAGEVVLTSTFA